MSGERVIAPALHLPLGCISAMDIPVGRPKQAEEPADIALSRRETRLSRLEEGAKKFARYGGAVVVQAAAKFLRLACRAFMPRTQQVAVLELINEIHDESTLSSFSLRLESPREGAHQMALKVGAWI